MLLINARIPRNGAFIPDQRVRLEEGEIREVGTDLTPAPGERTLDLEGDFLLPGFVDVHIHAFQGHDTMAGEEAVRAMSRALRKLGVAAFCPTTMSASPEETRRAVAGVRAVMARQEPEGARVLGAHMEAPFLNEGKAGAQVKAYFRDPDYQYFLDVTEGHPEAVRLMTLAPEKPGSEAFIRRAAAVGVHLSVGHTCADAETLHASGDWGADHVTHLFNAQTPLLHRAPGVPGAALADPRFWCEMICDGVHLHGDIIRLAAVAKKEKAVAITDAMEAAGLPEGIYHLGGQEVRVRGGEARLEDGTLAGSVLTMPAALHNLIHRFGIDPAQACAMCTENPAASIGETACGRIVPGSPATLTRWGKTWEMRSVVTEKGEEN